MKPSNPKWSQPEKYHKPETPKSPYWDEAAFRKQNKENARLRRQLRANPTNGQVKKAKAFTEAQIAQTMRLLSCPRPIAISILTSL